MSTPPFDPLGDLAVPAAHKAAARKQLAQLAEQTRHPELRELARAVLAGRMSLRAALTDPRATAVLDEQIGRFTAWYRELSVEERAEHERQAERFASESVTPSARHPRPVEEDDWTERPILRKRRR